MANLMFSLVVVQDGNKLSVLQGFMQEWKDENRYAHKNMGEVEISLGILAGIIVLVSTSMTLCIIHIEWIPV